MHFQRIVCTFFAIKAIKVPFLIVKNKFLDNVDKIHRNSGKRNSVDNPELSEFIDNKTKINAIMTEPYDDAQSLLAFTSKKKLLQIIKTNGIPHI